MISDVSYNHITPSVANHTAIHNAVLVIMLAVELSFLFHIVLCCFQHFISI